MYEAGGQATWYLGQNAMTGPTLLSAGIARVVGGQTLGGTFQGADRAHPTRAASACSSSRSAGP